MEATKQASTTVWLDPGVYKAECGCTMYVLEWDPVGPRLAIIEGECGEHALTDFVQVWSPRG